jgi:hypothetical protein
MDIENQLIYQDLLKLKPHGHIRALRAGLVKREAPPFFPASQII